MKHWVVPITIVSAITGLLMAAQFKVQVATNQELPSRRVEELVVMLKDAEAENKRLARQAETLKTQLKGARVHPAPGAPAARWGALEGPGVELSIDDSAKPLSKGENPNIAIVHNEDLLKIINELRAAGAEALALNDQRLVEASEISCAGPTILVNQTRLVPPFVIRAIGDPDTMMAALRLRGGVVEYLQFYGIQVNISKNPKVLVPMYHGGSAYQYARPLTSKKST